MNAHTIFERDLNGEMVSPSDPGYDELINAIWDTMKMATELNTGYHTPDEVRRILSVILGCEVDESITLLPPFYVDYGKHIKIGKGCFIQQCCTFFGRGGITLGENVFLGPKVNIITINHDPDPENRDATYGRPVVLEDRVWVGINATILPGVRIGYGAIVGANSVVTKDVPPYTIVGGIPAKTIRKRFSDDTIAALLKINWWDWPEEKIKRHISDIQAGRVNRLQPLCKGESHDGL